LTVATEPHRSLSPFCFNVENFKLVSFCKVFVLSFCLTVFAYNVFKFIYSDNPEAYAIATLLSLLGTVNSISWLFQ
jgi:hypothetical protein